MIRASRSSAFTVFTSTMAPRVMRAASWRTLRASLPAASPLTWSTTCICRTSGAMAVTFAPRLSRKRRVSVASWISEPSRYPLPARMTPTRFSLAMANLRLLGTGSYRKLDRDITGRRVVSSDAPVRSQETARLHRPRPGVRAPPARGRGREEHLQGVRPQQPPGAGRLPAAGGRVPPAGLPGAAEGPRRARRGEEEPRQAPVPAQLGEGHLGAGAARARPRHRPRAPRRRPRPRRALPVLGGRVGPRGRPPSGRTRLEGRGVAGCVAGRRDPARG